MPDDRKIKIFTIQHTDHQKIYGIMKSLDKWFDESALNHILIDLKYHKGYIAKKGRECIGFATYFVYEGVGIIGWIGVRLPYQDNKVGKKLLLKIEAALRNDNIHIMQVYTLSDSVEYEPYEKTRQFYYSNGFIEYRRIKTDNPSCPEELYFRKRI
jgi:GNAT superfamily N-acetyltransferase